MDMCEQVVINTLKLGKKTKGKLFYKIKTIRIPKFCCFMMYMLFLNSKMKENEHVNPEIDITVLGKKRSIFSME